MEQPFQPLNNLPLTTLVAGGSKIGGSEGRHKELGAAGFARDNKEVTYNAGKGINDDRKGRGVEVRYFQRVRGKQAVLKCQPARSGGGTSEAQYYTDAPTSILSKCILHLL